MIIVCWKCQQQGDVQSCLTLFWRLYAKSVPLLLAWLCGSLEPNHLLLFYLSFGVNPTPSSLWLIIFAPRICEDKRKAKQKQLHAMGQDQPWCYQRKWQFAVTYVGNDVWRPVLGYGVNHWETVLQNRQCRAPLNFHMKVVRCATFFARVTEIDRKNNEIVAEFIVVNILLTNANNSRCARNCSTMKRGKHPGNRFLCSLCKFYSVWTNIYKLCMRIARHWAPTKKEAERCSRVCEILT